MVEKKKKEGGFLVQPPVKENRVVVLLKTEAKIRYTGTEFVSVAAADVSGLKKCLSKYNGANINRVFSQTEEVLEREVASLSETTTEEIPGLSSYYQITTAKEEDAKTLIKDLEKEDIVEKAYIEPPTYLALFDEMPSALGEEAPPATPDFSNQQGYLGPATAGIDAKYAWTIPGGKGDGVKIIDIEGAWRFSHEDLRRNQGGVVCGTPTSNLGWENHGTAVAGEISGDHIPAGIGILGIAPNSWFAAGSIFGPLNSSAMAIKCAADRLSRGDIILIELHRPGPEATGIGQQGYIPIEYWAADYAAIRYATAKGIIVIAAAGNGAVNLDKPIYKRRFDRSYRDSGAILVGAGAPPSGNQGPDRSRLDFSNYGKIVDAQGWGREVVTTGYGDLQGGTDKNKWYTRLFSGTSSASPIVVGAVACLQGIRKAEKKLPYTYTELRNILRSTGSPQTNAPGRPTTQRIGNRPNLRAAIRPSTRQCDRYRIYALYYLKQYKITRNLRYLYLYYRYYALYHYCLYKVTRIRRHLCYYYGYMSRYYYYLYRVTRNLNYYKKSRSYYNLFLKCIRI